MRNCQLTSLLGVTMSRSERVSLVDQVLSVFDGRYDGAAWATTRVNMLLNGFEFGEVYDDPDYEEGFIDLVRRRLQDGDTNALKELSDHLFRPSSISPTVTSGDGLWTEEMVRVFLSHSATHKSFVTRLSDSLRVYGIDGFVAHDTIQVTREWQAEIERALRTAETFVGLAHPEFLESPWANQELGWAYGRELPIFMVRLGVDPTGFPGKHQWPSHVGDSPPAIAAAIARWVNSLPTFSDRIGGSLIAALRQASNYFDAGEAAEALNKFDSLTPEQFTELDQAYLENTQVHGSILAHRGLDPLYARHERSLPPRNVT